MKDLSTAEHQPAPSTQSTACSQMGMAGRKGRRELLTTTGLPSLPHPKSQRSTQTSPAAGCPRHTPTAGPGRNEAELNEPNKLSQVPHGTPAVQNSTFPFRAKLPFQKPKLQSLINLPNDENHPKTSSTAPVPTLCQCSSQTIRQHKAAHSQASLCHTNTKCSARGDLLVAQNELRAFQDLRCRFILAQSNWQTG